MILDIHTHHPAPQPDGIISVRPTELPPTPGEQLYSAGIHPWDVRGIGLSASQIDELRRACSRPDVAAVGETGIDMVRPGCAPLAGQINALRRHAEISEEAGKPLVLHCVRAHDVIAQTRKDMKPAMPWIIHGFRGKPSVARILLDAGCYLSYGERFNPESLRMTPPEYILAETDESPLAIREIIRRLSDSLEGMTEDTLISVIVSNTARLL